MPNEATTRRVISRTSVNKGAEGIEGSERDKAIKAPTIDLSSFVNTNSYNEDVELDETNIDQNFIWKDVATDKFRSLLDTIKYLHQQPVVDKNEIQSCYRKGLLICTTLKKLNRVSHLRVNKARIRTNEEKNKVDEHHLELQNLLYEISHIQKEINKCLEFRSLDEDINLVPVEEFYKNAPVEISNPEVTSHDPHKLKLARLDWELNERQSMKAKIKSLENLIEVHQNEIKVKHEQLDSLHPKLNKILEACKPTLEYLNMNFDDEATISESVQLLPKPLYTLHMMMLAYRDTTDKTVKVEVIGDVESAKRFDGEEQITLDDDDSGDSGAEDDGENENYKQKSKSKMKKKPVNKKDKVFTPYPLSVKISVSVKNTGQIILNLFYFNILKIVTVKPDLVFDKEIPHTDSALLRPESIFDCLYPNDNGTESPNIANKLLFSSIGVKSIESYVRTIGFPYKWCQVLCGLYYLNESDVRQHKKRENGDMNRSVGDLKNGDSVEMRGDDDNDDDFDNETDDIFAYVALNSNKNEAKILQKILFKLKSRFRSRFILQETVNSLRKGVVPTPVNMPVIRQLISKLTSFKESNYEKFASCEYAEHLLSSNLVNENDCIFYELNLTNGAAKLQSQIVVNLDYPTFAPLFAVNINWKTDRNFKNDESIRDIEREINICKDNFIEYDEEYAKRLKLAAETGTKNMLKNYELLAKQINHLIVCFDVYLESESYFLKNDEYPRYKFFLNSVRGKDRKRPYSYLTSRDIFVQRLNYESSLDTDKSMSDFNN